MIETSFVIWFIALLFVGMVIATVVDKTKGIRGFIVLIGVSIVIFGTIMICNSEFKDKYLGKPAIIENLVIDKDFWISAVLRKDLFEITDLETGKSIIVKDFLIENPEIGKYYFIAKIKDEKVVLLSKYSSKKPRAH